MPLIKTKTPYKAVASYYRTKVTSKKEKKFDVYQSIILSNPSLFTLGTIIPSIDFCNAVGMSVQPIDNSFKNVQSHNLAKVSHQVQLNKILAHRNLRIQSKDYYSKFEIVSTNDNNFAERYREQADRKMATSVIAERTNAIRAKARFTCLNTKEASVAAGRMFTN